MSAERGQMSCERAAELLGAWVIGEVDAGSGIGRSLAEHLQRCEACRGRVEAMRASLELVGQAVSAGAAPRMSEQRRAALRQAVEADARTDETGALGKAAGRVLRFPIRPRWLGIAASVALMAVAVWGLMRWSQRGVTLTEGVASTEGSASDRIIVGQELSRSSGSRGTEMMMERELSEEAREDALADASAGGAPGAAGGWYARSGEAGAARKGESFFSLGDASNGVRGERGALGRPMNEPAPGGMQSMSGPSTSEIEPVRREAARRFPADSRQAPDAEALAKQKSAERLTSRLGLVERDAAGPTSSAPAQQGRPAEGDELAAGARVRLLERSAQAGLEIDAGERASAMGIDESEVSQLAPHARGGSSAMGGVGGGQGLFGGGGGDRGGGGKQVDEQSEREADMLLRRALDLQRAQQYEQALAVLDQALFNDPGNIAAQGMKENLEDTLIARNFRRIDRQRDLNVQRHHIINPEQANPTPENVQQSPDRPQAVETQAPVGAASFDSPQEQRLRQTAEDFKLPEASMFEVLPVNPWVMTERDRFSTFAIDADTASYALCRRYIRAGYLPPAGAVRMEEFINAFDYQYPSRAGHAFAVHTEAAPSPFGENLTLLKVGVKAKTVGREGRKAAHLVFVVDASGSMERADRLPLVKRALALLAGRLGAGDRVSLVTYGTHGSLVLEAAPAGEARRVVEAVEAIQSGGSTNLVEGLRLGYEIARRRHRAGRINRVILCTDGVANVGQSDAESILAAVERQRRQGITLTVAGFGLGAYNDALLEKLANLGDGSYLFVDSEAEARRAFVEHLAATLQVVARDAKIQVAFDPRRVRRYRLIGYENRDLADAEFRNDAVDAGEVGSGQSATALYELELLEGPEPGDLSAADLGAVYVRYRDVDSGEVEEVSHRLSDQIVRRRGIGEAPRFYLAAAAAEFAELLRGSEHARGGNLEGVRRVLVGVTAALPLDERAEELLDLVRSAEGLPRAP